ncbi:MAG: diaminopimelate decarboxylase [Hyphomonadaceae bacterium]
MNHFAYRSGALCCEDVSLAAIAAAIGTPAYVYSSATLERHFQVFEEAVPRDSLIAFAVKANGNIAVLSTLARLGAGADTVSRGEIERALAAGVPAARIIFSGVGKTEDELAFAIDRGVHQINVESEAELDSLATLAQAHGKRPAIAIRVNPDIGAGAHDKITTGKSDAKFGVGLADARRLYARACTDARLDPQGFAVHIGSQIRDLAPLEAAFAALRTLVEDVRADGFTARRLDLGGGLGVPYFNEPDPPSPSEYGVMVQRVFGGLDVAFSFEPGRMIAANAGVLIARVVRIQARAERPIIVLDAGMNDLLRPAMYDAFHGLTPLIEPAADARRAPADIAGPICESGDTFARARMLPPLQAGDLVALQTAGAYGATMSSTYNARALAPEVLVKGDRFAVVRRRWSVAEQVALEAIPDWGIE